MKVSNTEDYIEFAELCKLFEGSKTDDVGANTMEVILETLKVGKSLKATRKELAFGKD